MSNPHLMLPKPGVARWQWTPTKLVGPDPDVVRDAVLAQLARMEQQGIPRRLE